MNCHSTDKNMLTTNTNGSASSIFTTDCNSNKDKNNNS